MWKAVPIIPSWPCYIPKFRLIQEELKKTYQWKEICERQRLSCTNYPILVLLHSQVIHEEFKEKCTNGKRYVEGCTNYPLLALLHSQVSPQADCNVSQPTGNTKWALETCRRRSSCSLSLVLELHSDIEIHYSVNVSV